jgi:hypothetical protein
MFSQAKQISHDISLSSDLGSDFFMRPCHTPRIMAERQKA